VSYPPGTIGATIARLRRAWRDDPPNAELLTPSCTVPGCRIPGDHRHLKAREVHRPHPAANAWPDDALTLSYIELRRLIALHLAQLAATMPRDRPWLFAEAAARAMAEGETPLRLREVLE
jgi:hypothetical protein